MNDVQEVINMTNHQYENMPTLRSLPPGYLLLASRPRKQPYLMKIMACNPTKEFQPFAVWTYNRSMGGCSNGHYYATLEQAEKEFLWEPEFAQ